eukprot:GHVT01076267.1.p1 GENE.GHVT01076267.1~~GHVT01076267.1.p1  ORF type:complete len:274 (+),score=67.45 GHVT01076267.1:40-822(+)
MTFPNASLQKEGSFVSSSSSALPADVPRSAPPPISPRVIDSLAAALSARPASGSGPLSPASPPAPGTMLLHRVVVEIPVIPDPNEKSVVLQFIQFLGGALFVWVGHSGCAKLEDLHVAFPNNSNPSSSPATSSTRVFGEEEGVSGQLAAKLASRYAVPVYVSLSLPESTLDHPGVLVAVQAELTKAMDRRAEWTEDGADRANDLTHMPTDATMHALPSSSANDSSTSSALEENQKEVEATEQTQKRTSVEIEPRRTHRID